MASAQVASGQTPLTSQERKLRRWLVVLTLYFGAQAILYLPEIWIGPAEARPFAINSFAKDLVFAALTGVAAADVRRFSRLIGLVIAGLSAIAALLAAALLTRYETVFPPPQWLRDWLDFVDVGGRWPFAGWLAGAIVTIAVLAWLYRRALRVRHGLRYLGPIEHDTLAAVADAILDDPEVPPNEIASRVDAYWDSLEIREKRRLRVALWLVCLMPLGWGKAPLPLLDRGRRRAVIERALRGDEATRQDLRGLRRVVQACVRFSMQLVYVGYYGDERSNRRTGYVPFADRRPPPTDSPPIKKLSTLSPPDASNGRLQADVVIVGSGAGGAMAAHALAERDRDVLVVERGPYVERSRFTEDEPAMYGLLYSDGALQLSRDFSLQVLQGMCVGGSTVVNNGVSFDLPTVELNRWNTRYRAGIDRDELNASFTAVRKLMDVAPQAEAPPNPIATRIGGLEPVEANLENCVGCGQCNIGCRYGRKLSMLDHVLPDAQGRHGDGLRILPDCEVEKVLVDGRRATGVRCRLRSGRGRGQTVEIVAKRAVVIAAGAIHSSLLLMRSGLGGERVGRRLSANLAAHMTGYFPDGDPLEAFAGLQMSHRVNGVGHAGHMIETWYSPVMSQALAMPGWLTDHQTNMHRYNRLGCLGVLVGSTPNEHNRVRRRAHLTGAQVDFTPGDQDLDALLAALRRAGALLLRGGATRVMATTFRYREFGSVGELAELRRGALVRDASDISITTAHPQGGNPMSRETERGVVDSRFCVHDVKNLHVCDASVFPSAITVNPQLTVMALGHLAGSRYIT